MSDSKFGCSYWEFAKIVKTERRFIFDGKAGNFLTAICAASRSRAFVVKAGPASRLYRAQIDSEFAEDADGFECERPSSEARMIPDSKYIRSGGRANPPGFAYLYLANTRETALAEMRPWIGESLTLAIFEILRDIKIVLCRAGSVNSDDLVFEENPSAEQIEQRVWNEISHGFSRPINRKDPESDYLPTQILAEAFKAEGFDGLAYQSGLERGTNVVLFDRHCAKLIHSAAYKLRKVSYEFEGLLPYVLYDKKDGGSQQVSEIHTKSS